MGWSTRELAELAGTTVKAVRHYHRIGLLDEPERSSNNYKSYDAGHLVRLLRIRRLADLGMPLSRIGTALSDPDPAQALAAIDAELAEESERIRHVRAELAAIVSRGVPADLPAGFTEVAADMSEADRALVLVYSRLLTPRAMEELRGYLGTAQRTPEDDEFDALTDDVEDAAREDLARRWAPQIAALGAGSGLSFDQTSLQGGPGGRGADVAVDTMRALYNDAQRDVLVRATRLLAADDAAPASTGDVHP